MNKDVNILGNYVDANLNFKKHIAEPCKKAGRKLNVLRRLSKYINIESSLSLCCFTI